MTCLTFKFSVCRRHLYLELRHNVDVTCSNVSGVGITARVVYSVRLWCVVWRISGGGAVMMVARANPSTFVLYVRFMFCCFFCLNSMIFNVQYGHLLFYIIV